jgi:hypothetical protein
VIGLEDGKRVQLQKTGPAAFSATDRRSAKHIGFTGTRQGMTRAQHYTLRDLLASFPGAILLHGDCIGADAEAHDISLELGYDVVIHPARIEDFRAFKIAEDTRRPAPALTRNKHIVRETELLIAAPAEAIEQLRSGTWSTVRFARRVGRPVRIILPDGSTSYFPAQK